MFYLVVIVLCFFMTEDVRAWDVNNGGTEEQPSKNIGSESSDLKLIVIDRENKQYFFALHSDILRNSKYFKINFELQDEDQILLESYTYHVASVDIFRKICRFLYGDHLDIKSYDEFIAILKIQEQLEINLLDRVLFEIIDSDNRLEAMQTRELAEILDLMHRSRRPFRYQMYERILKYISINHKLSKNCSRDDLVSFLRNKNDLIYEIDLVTNRMHAEKTLAAPLSLKVYDKNVRKKAKKIYKKKLIPGNTVVVSKSHEETLKVMELLKSKYQVASVLLPSHRFREGKYTIKITKL